MKLRCGIFTDGSNFYFKLKDLGLQNLLQFDFSEFSKMLVKKDTIIDANYYVGRIRTDGTVKTQRLFNEKRNRLSRERCRR